MLSITNHQGNANQNHNEILPHTSQNDHHQKKSTNNKCWMDAEEKEPSSSVGGDVNWCSDYAEQCGGSAETASRATTRVSSFTSGHVSGNHGNDNSKRYTRSSVHSSIIDNSQDVLMNRRIVKGGVVHACIYSAEYLAVTRLKYCHLQQHEWT